MQIETGKFYRAEDGRKVGPMLRFDDGLWNEPDSGGLWKYDGTAHFPQVGDSPKLVSEWTDGPVVTETVTRIIPGQYGYVRVRCVHNNRVGIIIGATKNATTHYFDAAELDEVVDLFTILAKALRS